MITFFRITSGIAMQPVGRYFWPSCLALLAACNNGKADENSAPKFEATALGIWLRPRTTGAPNYTSSRIGQSTNYPNQQIAREKPGPGQSEDKIFRSTAGSTATR